MAYLLPLVPYPMIHRPRHPGIWTLDLFFYLFDVLGLPEIISFAVLIMQPQSRRLNEEEKRMADSIFKDNLDNSKIWLRPVSHRLIRKFAEAYVLFNVIHYAGTLKDEIYMHELTHVYQYQRFGSMYIGRSLLAQKSEEGYDYGGAIGLYHAMISGKSFDQFNFEQQCEIIQDYCVLLKNSNHPKDLYFMSYQYYVDRINRQSSDIAG